MSGMDVVDLRWSPYEIGMGLGEALAGDPPRLRKFQAFVEQENAQVKEFSTYSHKEVSRIGSLLKREPPSTEKWLAGMAEGIGLKPDELLLFSIGCYFHDLIRTQGKGGKEEAVPGSEEGCSTFCLSESAVGPIVAKNRDCRAGYKKWQVMIRVRPERGYGYLAVTTYGIPGVNSSGMNSEGLAVADTHVLSKDIGIGLPRFVLEHEILTQCRTVREALGLIISRPLMGRGNLILADAEGNLGVTELGHRVCATRSLTSGFLANTNHFTDPVLQGAFVDVHPAPLQGTSQSRYLRLINLLSDGCHDLERAKQIMAYHGSDLDSLCRHEELDPPSRTISTVFYLPREGRAVFSQGYPCMASYQEVVWE